jgi:hypothetical protein
MAAPIFGMAAPIFVVGATGIGKSMLLRSFLGHARQQTPMVFESAAVAIEATTPFYIWKAIFRMLLAPETVAQLATLSAAVREVEPEPSLSALSRLSKVQPQLARDDASAVAGASEEDVSVELPKRLSMTSISMPLRQRSLKRMTTVSSRRWFGGAASGGATSGGATSGGAASDAGVALGTAPDEGEEGEDEGEDEGEGEGEGEGEDALVGVAKPEGVLSP